LTQSSASAALGRSRGSDRRAPAAGGSARACPGGLQDRGNPTATGTSILDRLMSARRSPHASPPSLAEPPSRNSSRSTSASPDDLGSLSTISQAASQLGAVASAVAGLVAFVYLVGGAVMWIRFRTAELPPDQAVGLVGRKDLMVVGLRVLVLPALLAGVLFVMLARRHRRRVSQGNGRGHPKLLVGMWLLVIAALLVVVPLTPGALAWPLAAATLWLVWARSLSSSYHPNGHANFPMARAAAVAVLLAATVSLARQVDHPVELAAATVQVGHEAPQVGVLVSENDDEVAVGFPDIHSIRLFRRAEVRSLLIGPGLDRRAPSPSLLSRLLGGPAWAATPLEVWCDGQHYAAWELAKLCATQPVVIAIQDRTNRTAGVELDCPRAATPACSGFLTLTTAHPVAVSSLGRKAKAVVGRTSFQIPAGSDLRVDVPVDPRLRRLLARTAEPTDLEATVSLDLAGDAVIGHKRLSTRFAAPSHRRTTANSRPTGRPKSGRRPMVPAGRRGGAPAPGPGAGQRRSGATPASSPGPAPTPPTSTPAGTDTPAAPAEPPAPGAPIELGSAPRPRALTTTNRKVEK
jgi:hypothetical protein